MTSQVFVSYTGDGTNTAFDVPFPYLDVRHVFVRVAGVDAPFTWANSGRLVLSSPPAAGAAVTVYRSTPTAPLYIIPDNRPAPAAWYNKLATQAIYLSEENGADGSVQDAVQALTERAEQAASDAAAALQAVVGAVYSTSDLAELLASPRQFTLGSVVNTRKENYSFTVVSSGPHRVTAGGVMLRAVWRGDQTDLLASGIDTTGAGDASPLLAAYLAARAGTTVAIPPGTYRLNSSVSVLSGTNLDLRNCTFNLNGLVEGQTAIRAVGTQDAAVTMSARPVKGSRIIYLTNTAGFAKGDTVKIMANAAFDPARTNSQIGELGRVSNVYPDRIVLYNPLMDGYDVGTSGRVAKVNPVRRVNIIGPAKFNGFDRANCKGILLENAVDCRISGLDFERFDDRALWLIDCDNITGDSLTFTDFDSPGTGYGISATDATQNCRFTAITGRRVRHLFATNNRSGGNGIPRHIAIDGFAIDCSAYAEGGTGGDALDTHAASEHITFANGVIRGATGCGINSEGASTLVSNVQIYDCLSHGVYASNFSNRQGTCVIDNVTVVGAGEVGIKVRGNGGQAWQVVKIDAHVRDCLGGALDVAGPEAKLLTDIRVVGSNVGGNIPFYLLNCRYGNVDMACDGQSVTANSVHMFRLRDCINISARLTGRMANSLAASKGVYIDTATASRNVTATVNIRNEAGPAGTGVEVFGGTNIVVATTPRVIDNFATAVVVGP